MKCWRTNNDGYTGTNIFDSSSACTGFQTPFMQQENQFILSKWQAW
jgi:hypothetical protein